MKNFVTKWFAAYLMLYAVVKVFGVLYDLIHGLPILDAFALSFVAYVVGYNLWTGKLVLPW